MFEKFSLTIGVKKANFNELEIKLVDYYDSENVFTLSMVKNASTNLTEFEVNGVKQSGVFQKGGFYTIGGELTTLAYMDGKISADVNFNFTVSNFAPRKVLMSVTMKGVTGEAGVAISNLFGQATNMRSNTATDRQAPISHYYGDIPGSVYLNDTLTIPALVSEDVLDPCVVNTVTVTGPDGKVLLNNVNIDKDITLKITEYGKYKIQYKAVDTSGKAETFDEYVTCLNTTKPVITVSGEVTKSIKLGGVITLPSATATDDVDETVEVKYFIVESTGTIRLLDQTRKFKPTRAGRYTARYYAVDSSGNATIVDYIFVVGG